MSAGMGVMATTLEDGAECNKKTSGQVRGFGRDSRAYRESGGETHVRRSRRFCRLDHLRRALAATGPEIVLRRLTMNRKRKLPFMAAALISSIALSAWSTPPESKKPKASLLETGLQGPSRMSVGLDRALYVA